MSRPRGVARSLAVALVLLALAVTGWVCLVAGIVLLLADRIGAGPALIVVAGALLVLVALPVAAGAMRGGGHGPSRGLAAEGALRTGLAVIGMPGGWRVLAGLAGLVLAGLATGALWLALRGPGARDGKG